MLRKAYELLEENTPNELKTLIPESWRIWAGFQIKKSRRYKADHFDELNYALEMPAGETEDSLISYLSQFREGDDWANRERDRYLQIALHRFIYTLQLLPKSGGKLLEIGAHPYFISLLLRRFTPYELTFVNYFGNVYPKHASQSLVRVNEPEVEFEFDNVNIETEITPYKDDTFDVVIMCEVLEHLIKDPKQALLEVKRILKPGGAFVLSTPNVARPENVARLLSGMNLYDQYSGYGPYGRHNREYTVEELRRLLEDSTFEIDDMFTSDIGKNRADKFYSSEELKKLIWDRKADLGQHIFVRAINSNLPAKPGKPTWLYRSYPDDELLGDKQADTTDKKL